MNAAYRFAVRFRLDPPGNVVVQPTTFETAFRYEAPTPGEDGWLFFRDYLWRGEVNDPAHVRELVGDALGVSIESVAFRAFETDAEYLAALREAVAADLDEFRADSVDEVLNKYLGSAVEVV